MLFSSSFTSIVPLEPAIVRTRLVRTIVRVTTDHDATAKSFYSLILEERESEILLSFVSNFSFSGKWYGSHNSFEPILKHYHKPQDIREKNAH